MTTPYVRSVALAKHQQFNSLWRSRLEGHIGTGLDPPSVFGGWLTVLIRPRNTRVQFWKPPKLGQ